MLLKRGCGTRTPGGVYLETGFSTRGIPLQYFIIDPPWVPLNDDGTPWLVPSQGLHVLQRPGTDKPIHDAYNWVGTEGYPHFPDFYEEGARYEFSTKAQPGLQFELLNNESWLMHMFAKGMVLPEKRNKYKKLYQSRLPGTRFNFCPHHKEHHNEGKTDEFCTGLLWQLVDKPQPQGDRMHTVLMPRSTQDQFSYLAVAPPTNYKLTWVPAICLKLPIHRIVVIEDPFSDTDDINYDKVAKSGTTIPVEMVKE